MKVYQAFRYELSPNNKQLGLLTKACGVARFTWNWGLTRRKELYITKQGNERFIRAYAQHKELVALKKTEYSWMYDVAKSISEASLRDLDFAYANMGRKIKKHEKKIGKPKFKKKGIHDSFRVDNGNKNQSSQLIDVNGEFIKISKIGWIKCKESTVSFRGRILNAVISREADRWFCSLSVEVDRPNPSPVQGDIVGIDLGINCFATISNGAEIKEINSPKPLRKNLIKEKRYNRCLSKKKIGSKNRKKAQLKYARLCRRIHNIRKDFLAKESSKLAKTKSVIVIEDLAVKNMMGKHHLGRSIGDEGWGMFRRMLISRFYPSSKRCNHCGFINNRLERCDRTWVCLNCGETNERDPNAANNIRDCGIEILHTESSSVINACGVGVRPPTDSGAVHDEAGSKLVLDDQTYGTEKHLLRLEHDCVETSVY